jgi:hypothetical protein
MFNLFMNENLIVNNIIHQPYHRSENICTMVGMHLSLHFFGIAILATIHSEDLVRFIGSPPCFSQRQKLLWPQSRLRGAPKKMTNKTGGQVVLPQGHTLQEGTALNIEEKEKF